jgi:hypothetical protein
LRQVCPRGQESHFFGETSVSAIKLKGLASDTPVSPSQSRAAQRKEGAREGGGYLKATPERLGPRLAGA